MSTISIPYRLANSDHSCTMQLFYTMEQNETLLNLNCYVEASHPHELPWMQTRNFKIRYYKKHRHYVPSANEPDYEKTIDAILFMNKACNAIMAKEGLPVVEEAPQLI